MKRLYYLADQLEIVDAVAATLGEEGGGRWHLHVVSGDDAGVYQHHLHPASPLQQRDVIRLCERGVLFGFSAGLLVAALVVDVLNYFPAYQFPTFIVITALITLFGAWVGGMAGLCLESHRIKRFHDAIDAGRYLLLIDVEPGRCERIRRVLEHLDLEEGGEDNTLVFPFEPRRA